MDGEELPATFDGLNALLNEEEVGVSENVGSKATVEGTRHAKNVLTYLGKAEGSTEGMDTEELPVTFDGLNALLNGGEVGVSLNIGSKATVEGTHHAKDILTLGKAEGSTLGKVEGSTEGIDGEELPVTESIVESLEAVDNKLNGVGITYASTYASIDKKL